MRKFENFCNSLTNLKDIYKYNEPYGNVELAGMIGLFEICFEQAWKSMKEILEHEGFPQGQTGSPRQILKTAYQANMISDESIWISALIDRHNVTHTYNESVAIDVINKIKSQYVDMFEQLEKTIREQWLR